MRYVHHIPGRIRFRAEALKGNSACANSLAKWLGSVSGVECVQVNPLTGSVLVYYRPEAANGDDLIARCRRRLGAMAIAPASLARTAGPIALSEDVQRAAAKLAAGYLAQVVIERSLVALLAALF